MNKYILSVIVTLSLATACIAEGTASKTKRMIQIEKKFSMVMQNIIVDKDQTFWLFKAEFTEGLFGFVPVMVKPDASDTEVIAALMSSKTCANLYDDTIKKAFKKAQQDREPKETFQ